MKCDVHEFEAWQVEVGGVLLAGTQTSLYANFRGEFARAIQLNSGKGGVKVLF